MGVALAGVVWLHRLFSTCLGAIDDLTFPWSCRVCGVELSDSPFCDDCRAELVQASARVCARCAMPIGAWSDARGGCWDCRGRPLGFDGAIALGPYVGPIRDLCLQLKHERNAWLARWLVELLVEARVDALREHREACVVPVPLHWSKRFSRGYDQADALAAKLADRLGLNLSRPLCRVLGTPKLARKGRLDRTRLMRDAFRARRERIWRGRTVLLVDDILTTGATSGAAARALKKAGADRVIVVVIGRAEGRP
jgi:ComF family protein